MDQLGLPLRSGSRGPYEVVSGKLRAALDCGRDEGGTTAIHGFDSSRILA
jgi:hypothetical protein